VGSIAKDASFRNGRVAAWSQHWLVAHQYFRYKLLCTSIDDMSKQRPTNAAPMCERIHTQPRELAIEKGSEPSS
jgi:hypothetical protein